MTEMFMKVRCMHTGDNCRIHQESETEREIYICRLVLEGYAGFSVSLVM